MGNKVTIGFFAIEGDGPGTYGRAAFNEHQNVKDIVEKLVTAAINAGDEPPEFEFSILFVPNWKKENNSYENETFKQTRDKFFKEVKAAYQDINIKIKDFYSEGSLTEGEKGYLHELRANGSNADIVKTRAIIDNVGNKHLQLDTNTIILDYSDFYKQTFKAPQAKQQDAFSPIFYNPHFISGNNKIVYTPERSKFAQRLKDEYLTYCETNQDNTPDKAATQNSVFNKIFAPVTSELGYTEKHYDVAKGRVIYPAHMQSDAYRIATNVVCAVNMSWSTQADKDMLQLKEIPPLQFKDATCDVSVFSYLVKKYTAHPYSLANHNFFGQLHEISDQAMDMELLVAYFNHALEQKPEVAQKLVQIFPDNKAGKLLVKALFDCTVKELHDAEIKPPAKIPNTKALKLMKKELIDNDKDITHKVLEERHSAIPKVRFENLVGKEGLKLDENNPEQRETLLVIAGVFNSLKEGDEKSFKQALQQLSQEGARIKQATIAVLKDTLSNATDKKGAFNFLPHSHQMLSQLQSMEHELTLSKSRKSHLTAHKRGSVGEKRMNLSKDKSVNEQEDTPLDDKPIRKSKKTQ